MIPYILLILGIALLVKSADLLVDGGSALAKKLKVSNLVIGLTIIAFGTSAPETVVSVLAAMSGEPDLAIGNIVGSVVTNILLGLGVAAVIYPLSVKHGTVWKEIPLSLLAVVILFFLANDQLVANGGLSQLSWTDGLALLGFFTIFLYYTFGLSKAQPDDTVQEHVEDMKTGKATVFVLLGFIGLALGANWIVDNAVIIAQQIGFSEKFIALLIIGPGTSLPELTAAVIAARKRNVDLAVGGIVGSNIYNIFMILGLSALLGELPYDPALNVDIMLIFGASLLLFFALFTGKRHIVDRWQGAAFLIVYACYIVYLFIRG